MYNYIPHPSNSRMASQVLALRIEEGAAGYGIYWMLLELLRDAPNYKFSANPKALSFAINEHDLQLVERVVRNYGLFDFDNDGLMFSPWLCEAMGEYDDRKAKLREAGRRGAAHRWGDKGSRDSEAMATLSNGDSEAMAHNVTQRDITLHDITLPDLSGSPKVSQELVEALSLTQQEGHAPGYVAQICLQYGMSEGALNFLCEHSNNADLTHPTYKRFCALVRRIQGEKWAPKHPDGFFLKKVFE